MTATVAPYGTWSSPITPATVVEAGVRPGEVHLVDGAVFWSESRPVEGGRIQIRCRDAAGDVHDLLPQGWSARTRVHEYGGGAWIPTSDALYFSSWDDQRVHRLALDGGRPVGEPQPITPAPTSRHGARYADLRAVGSRLIAVRETHPDGAGPSGVVNEIVSIAADGSESVLVSGPDFVMAPRADAAGARLAWIEWDHPSMPWDATTLCVAALSPEADAVVARTVVTGGPDRGESAVQPMWAPDGTLVFASDRTGWWNLYRFDPVAGSVTTVTEGEWELAEPQWVFAMSRAAITADGRVVGAAMADGVLHLRLFEPGDTTGVALDTGLCDFASVRAEGTTVGFVGASFTTTPAVYTLDVTGLGAADSSAELRPVVAGSGGSAVDPSWISSARHITFPSGPDRTRQAHALYYPPTNPDHAAPEGTRPPVIARIHGGPTGAARSQLSLEYQFWTSRGFAIVDVNYGGSVGYGRAYRDSLRDNWGIVDVEDCVAAVEHLADAGLADPDRLLIQGGSAGGFTVLAALAGSDVFAAGASLYGVADLTVLATETHKFESRYLDGLIGPYPEAADVYTQRSPLTHVDDITSPLIVFQGLDDEVVPPNQSEAIVDAVQAKGVRVEYHPFEGEGHGFRRAENQITVLEKTLAFFRSV